MTNAAILGIPLDLGAENLGVDIGPVAFRDRQIIEKLTHAGLAMSDEGNIACNPRNRIKIGDSKLKYLEEILKVSEESAKKTYDLVKQGTKVVALGGDHSICLGVISGASAALNGELGLIYLDAHGDMNTPETTLTGNIHGMPLSALMGYGNKQLTSIFKQQTKIAKANMIHIGGIDFDKGELELIKKEKLNCFTITDMLSNGFKPLLENIEKLSAKVKNIWVSLDLDVIDEMYAPGVGMPNKGGLTYKEIRTIVDFISSNCNVVGIDIDEYNPLTDSNGKTAELGIELAARLLGKNYSWYSGYMDKNKL